MALAGEGKVIWVKPYDPAEPQKPHGMGVQFVQIDPDSRETLNRILQAKGNPRAPAAPRTTGPQPTLQRASAAPARANGRAHVDTNVDLAAEYGIDEVCSAPGHRSQLDDRDRGPADEDLEALLKPEPAETATLAQALAELPRLLDPAPRHRSGPARTLERGAARERRGQRGVVSFERRCAREQVERPRPQGLRLARPQRLPRRCMRSEPSSCAPIPSIAETAVRTPTTLPLSPQIAGDRSRADAWRYQRHRRETKLVGS